MYYEKPLLFWDEIDAQKNDVRGSNLWYIFGANNFVESKFWKFIVFSASWNSHFCKNGNNMFNWKQVAQRFDVDYERFRKFVSQRFPDLKPAETTAEVAQLFRTLNPVCRFGPDEHVESDKENDEDRPETADQPKKRSGLQRAAETYLRQMYQLRDVPVYFLRTEQIVFLSHVFYVRHNRSAAGGPVQGALDFRYHVRRLKRHKVEIHRLSRAAQWTWFDPT
jgi:hypothetical protein